MFDASQHICRIILFILITLYTGKDCAAATFHFSASKDQFNNSIKLSWGAVPDGSNYILRSETPEGPFARLKTLSGTTFIDDNIEPGVKYWYKFVDESNTIISADWGFSRPIAPRGLMPEEILSTRTKKLPKPSSENERKKWDSHLAVMEDFYENYISVSIIIFIGKIYILRGDLIAFRDFTDYTIDYDTKTIYVIKNGITPVKFHSKRLFRFLKRCKKNNIDENEILPRLISNAIFFCVKRENHEQAGSDRKVRLIPVYEALGMSTEYFRDYKKWRSHSIVFGSDTKDLNDLIEKNRNKQK